MGKALDHLLEQFDNPVRDGRGWKVICPAHADHSPSLHIEEAADGSKVLLTCRAGCDTSAVLDQVGVQAHELFETHWAKANGSTAETRGQGRPAVPVGPPLATYDYPNEQNTLLYQVLRYATTDGGKTFRMRKPTNADPGQPMWTDNVDGVRLVLYRLPEVIAAKHMKQRIYIVEGEKDADNLAKIGLTATTARGGAKAPWLPGYTDTLTGAPEVCIIPDNDDPGRAHALKVRDAIADWVGKVRMLTLPNLPEKGDASDYLEAGGTAASLNAIADSTDPFIQPSQRFTAVAISLDQFMSKPYAKPRSLLGDGLISAGDLAFIYGRPGVGKTWFMLQGIDQLARGGGLFGLKGPDGGPITIGVLELETNAYWFQQRMHAICKDTDRTGHNRIRVVCRPDLKGAVDMLTPDYLAIQRWCLEDGLDLLFIDALSRAHSTNENDGEKIGQVLRRFDEICFETGTAICPLHHEPKGPKDGKDLDDMDALRGHSRMQSDSKALIRLVDMKRSDLFALRFPKTNNAPPIDPIYLTRPAGHGFLLSDFDPDQTRDANMAKVADAIREAGPAGITDQDLITQTCLSKRTVQRHRAALGAVPIGSQEVGQGKAKKLRILYVLPGSAAQSGSAPQNEDHVSQGSLDV